MSCLCKLSAGIILSISLCLPVLAQDALFVDSDGEVGIGIASPSAPLHIFRDDPTQKFMYLQSDEFGAAQDRAMMQLINNGGIRFQFDNTALDTTWRFQAATGNNDNFEITKAGSGAVELRLDGSGNMTIAGTLTELSDVNAKQNITELSGELVLAKLEQLPVSEWSYKSDPKTRHIGPMAQDFHAVFGLGSDDTHISPRDMAGVNMAAIKALKVENEALKTGLAEKDTAIALLAERLEELEALMQAQK